MSAVSESIVREYFELHGFFVRQQRKYSAPSKREDEEIDFFVLNPRYAECLTTLPFVLGSADLAGLNRAIVVVKGWHTETFSLAVLENAPEIFRFVEPRAFRQATRAFGNGGRSPRSRCPRVAARPRPAQSIQLSGAKASTPCSLHTMLSDLIEQTEANRNY